MIASISLRSCFEKSEFSRILSPEGTIFDRCHRRWNRSVGPGSCEEISSIHKFKFFRNNTILYVSSVSKIDDSVPGGPKSNRK
jgi:hypothetical protein